MKVLVTGGSGFIGSCICRRLIKEGHSVRVLCRKNSDLSSIRELNFERTVGDISDVESLRSALTNIEAVFHIAGYVGYSKRDQRKMELVNYQGTKNVVDVSKELAVKRILYMSSVITIGYSENKIPISETARFNYDISKLYYAESKIRAEKYVLDGGVSCRLEAVVVNPGAVYGPGDAVRGSRSVQVRIARKEFPYFSDGGVCIVALEDVVDGVMAAFERGRTGERYILGGENITIKRMGQLIADAAGVRPPPFHLPNRVVRALGVGGGWLERIGLGGPLKSGTAYIVTLYNWYDSSKAIRDLEYNPRSAKLAIESSVNWMKENHILD